LTCMGRPHSPPSGELSARPVSAPDTRVNASADPSSSVVEVNVAAVQNQKCDVDRRWMMQLANKGKTRYEQR